ncbi:hypothetical protein ABGF48_08525, partial [Helcococcus bovis]|uniref:hypothetical protein n=1 Tax=Helcococcus bovis TaxID=3153252 RepID=UPI0038B804B0
GVTVGKDGKLTGTPNVAFNGDEETKDITIPVTLTNGKDEVVENVTVTVQRDTDGDGQPDVTDQDDDGDGYSDE